MSQTVDPVVSKAKFRREVARLRQNLHDYSARGWWLRSARFPIVEIGFVAVKASPPLVIAIARFDFTDYDVMPLSVTFHDATGSPLPKERMQTALQKMQVRHMPHQVEADQASSAGAPTYEIAELIQGIPGRPAFLCLPGVRQYHENAAHSGDPWEVRRTSGEGTLIQLAEKIWQYGADPVHGLEVAFSMKPAVQIAVPA